MTDRITAIQDAADIAAAAELRLKRLVADAVAAGAEIPDIAEAAGVTRSTVYRWAAEARVLRLGQIPEELVLRDVLREVSLHLPPYEAYQVRNRAESKNRYMLLIGLRMARTWLATYYTSTELDDETRGMLALASSIENRWTIGDQKEVLDD